MRALLVLALALVSAPAFAVGALGYVNVKDYGALGNGTSDDWAALQNVVDNVAAERATIYFPAGHYYVTQTLNCGTKAFNFRGVGRPMPYNVWLGGTFIRGNFAGPILKSAYPAGNLSIEDMGFTNWHAQGQGLDLSGSNVALLRISVIANKGIIMAPNAFTTSMQQIVVRCQAAWPAGSVGVAVRGHALIHGADIVGCETGLRVAGIGNDIRSLRVEVNRTGIELGVNPDGTNNPIIGGSVESLSLEANDYGIVVRAATSVSVRNVLIQGSVNAPSGQSKVGLLVTHSQWTAYEQVITGGAYSEAGIRVTTAVPTTRPITFQMCNAGNGTPGGVTWDVPSAVTHPRLIFEQCDPAVPLNRARGGGW